MAVPNLGWRYLVDFAGGLGVYCADMSTSDTVLDVAQLARVHTREMIDVIHEIASDPTEKAGDRLRAANMMLDRGHGTPTQSIIQIPAERQRRIEDSKYTTAQLERIVMASPEFQALQREAVDAEYQEVDTNVLTDPLLA